MLPFKSNRMVLLLWFVGYCDYFPVKLVGRIGGHPEWNRHVMYRAVNEGYVSVYRFTYRQRVMKSLRLTFKGVEYLGTHDVKALNIVTGMRQNRADIKGNHETIVRLHALATVMVMAYNAGAELLPEAKPKLSAQFTDMVHNPAESGKAYFYSAHELRKVIQEDEPDSQPKTSRLAGIIVAGDHLYCLYYTGFSQMYWRNGNEANVVNAIDSVLVRSGMECKVCSQVIIGTQMRIATKLARRRRRQNARYFAITEEYDHCYYLENTAYGDELLKLIINPREQRVVDRYILKDYDPAPAGIRRYDAVTKDGTQPVILEYTCDLLRLIDLEDRIEGFSGNTILTCFDYQADAVQEIVGPLIEVRTIGGGWRETSP